ncbi:DNA polymerase alpha subunit B [Camellia lanceoleosa]|uniref:DNA polymerase alpha subunit B n=1 Tax=Camellia lanceoleosa TaxID=1840588 RepID=A0ACC0G6I7_9ERIC|nr:DNA polymerase alpha subunit B [Camellia lanceoleosa]
MSNIRLSLIIAAGPFTTTDNLFFGPLTELLAYARRKQPQLLLLLGPFIDSEHPEIKKGAVNRSFDEIFRLEILGRLQDYLEYMGSAARVILPAFDIQQADLKRQITSLTNPGIFSANEIKVGCCIVDILKQLSGEEISRNPSGGSKQRMNRLANHLLSQHRHVLSIGDKNDGEEQAKCICVNQGKAGYRRRRVSSWSLTSGSLIPVLQL